jgi:hypothetical protein
MQHVIHPKPTRLPSSHEGIFTMHLPPTVAVRRLLIALSVAISAIVPLREAAAGTDILHISFKTAMTRTDVDTDARGSVLGALRRQGNAFNQALAITVTDLDPNTPYELHAVVGDDPNAVPIFIEDFTTDRKGKFKIKYTKRGQGNGGGRDPLPEELDPLTVIRDLFVLDAGMLVVLEADLDDADKWQHLEKRAMDETDVLPGASGWLRIKGHPNTSQFRLHAKDLTPGAEYRLAINEEILATVYTADSRGKLKIKNFPAGSPDLRDIRTVELIDALDAVVLFSAGLGTAEDPI